MSNSDRFEQLKKDQQIYLDLDKKYWKYVENALNNIGYAYVKQRQQVCREKPKEKLHHFKLFKTSNLISWNQGIMLWHGISEFIPCEITPFPTKEEDFGPYIGATKDKDTQIKLRATLHDENLSKPTFEVMIWDEGKLLPSHFDKKLREFESVENALDYLRSIEIAIE